jgi:probable HAF family extracellular repeat protein
MQGSRFLRRSFRLLLGAAAIACNGDSLNVPLTGTLTVTTSTAGAEVDSDGYTVQMDAQPTQAIGAAATVQSDEVAVGDHTVQLAGIAGNCTVAGENPRSIRITAGETTAVSFEVGCITTRGSLKVISITSGLWPDVDGYTVAVDGKSQGIGLNSVSITTGLVAGVHLVTLDGMAANCRVDGESSRPVTVVERQQATVTFAVFCPAVTGRYESTDLGELDGGEDFSFANAINPAGQVVGYSNVGPGSAGSSITRGWLWENGIMTDLGTLGGASSVATGINPSGEVVGYSDVGTDGTTHAFLWRNGVMTDLGALGGGYGDALSTYSAAYGISAKGQVVGISLAPGGQSHAFLWDKGVMRDLGTLGGSESGARAINREDQVVGFSLTAQEAGRGFLWENGVMTDLGSLAGRCCSVANGINRHGQVVGYVYDLNEIGGQDPSTFLAFVWKKGVMTELAGLSGVPSVANAININGQIVVCTGDKAVLWQDGVMTDIGGLTREGRGCAKAINPAGQMIGESLSERPGGGLVGRATLWSPK